MADKKWPTYEVTNRSIVLRGTAQVPGTKLTPVNQAEADNLKLLCDKHGLCKVVGEATTEVVEETTQPPAAPDAPEGGGDQDPPAEPPLDMPPSDPPSDPPPADEVPLRNGPGVWNFNPAKINRYGLKRLNTMVAEVDTTVELFEDVKEARAFMSQDFVEPEG